MDILHKFGICISYNDLLLLYDAWALMDAESSERCPPEIADDKPVIAITDNDDFKIDTISGNANCAHRTNVMFVQPESYEKERTDTPIAPKTKKQITLLKEKYSKVTTVRMPSWVN